MHTLNVNQTTTGNTVFIYSIKNGSVNVVTNTTWADSTTGQNAWNTLSDNFVVTTTSETTTYTRVNAVGTNVDVARELWVALPINK